MSTWKNTRLRDLGENAMLKVEATKLGTAAVVNLEGQVVTGQTDPLVETIHCLNDSTIVILNFARVTTVDAHGLGVMLQLREELQQNGIRFKLMNVSRPMGRILEITRLNSVFEVIASVELFPSVPRRVHTSAAA